MTNWISYVGDKELAKYHKLGRIGKQKRQKVTGRKGKDRGEQKREKHIFAE